MAYLQYMLPHQIGLAVRENWPAVIPAGCVEFHGNHLPLGTDLIIVEEIMRRVEKHVKIVVCPSVAYGPTGYAISGPEQGTIDVRPGAFKDHMKDILLALYRTGFRKFVVPLQHQGPDGPEGASFKLAAAEVYNELKNTHGNGWYTDKMPENSDSIPIDLKVMGSTAGEYPWPGSHGAWGETEPMMALKPETVDMGRLERGDFWWNWCPGNEADRSDPAGGMEKIDRIVKDWVRFFHENYPQTKDRCLP